MDLVQEGPGSHGNQSPHHQARFEAGIPGTWHHAGLGAQTQNRTSPCPQEAYTPQRGQCNFTEDHLRHVEKDVLIPKIMREKARERCSDHVQAQLITRTGSERELLHCNFGF
uniref:COX assembly mitochondrial protein homolog isoform X2 n=1 Tax=Phascolarctos cinereus TaxID=38626 RepID=A0A6P5KTB4_PHACI|nr:COX assembly mitochondrial protein homolog isoform X2 [Phascolarctos cinereus]